MRMIQQPRIQAWQPFVFFANEFSKAECETIVHLSKFIQPQVAATGGSDTPVTDARIRSSELHWMNETDHTRWIYDRLESVSQKVKQSWYPFNMAGFVEPLQLTRYYANEGGHYDWHQDFGPEGMSTRKLSLVVLLTDPADFKGGELQMMGIPGEDKTVKTLLQGTVVAFPSWEFHRVLKITEGERWSLVSWIHGPPFA